MVHFSCPSCRTGLLLVLMLCTFTRVVLGEITTREVIVLERDSIPKLRSVSGGARDESLEVADEQVIQSQRNTGGANDQKLKRFFDYDEAKIVTENFRNRKLKVAPTPAVADNTLVAKDTNSTNATVVPSSPPPVQSKSNTSQPASPANGPVTSMPPTRNPSAGDEKQSLHGGICDHGPVIGKLMAANGDGTLNYILTISTSENSKLNVTIKTPHGLEARPKELVLEKGKAMPVTISVIDNEVVGHGAQINISWGTEDCHVDTPSQKFVDDVDHSSYMDYVTASGVFPLVLGGSLVFILLLGIAGVWGCVSWRARSQRHGDSETKYQELEMALPVTMTKGDDEAPPPTDGWDEVWEDDDWQDTEAVRASSTSLSVSAAGLNSRRANEDGWDSSWDD